MAIPVIPLIIISREDPSRDSRDRSGLELCWPQRGASRWRARWSRAGCASSSAFW